MRAASERMGQKRYTPMACQRYSIKNEKEVGSDGHRTEDS